MRRRRYVEAGGSGRGLYEDNIVVPARLVLHFDINKTVTWACPLRMLCMHLSAATPAHSMSSHCGIQKTGSSSGRWQCKLC
jgi:hypothetical protein